LTTAESLFKPPYFVVGKTLNPKFEKRYKGGEDALVVSKDRRMLSVCDGVGGWGELDVDPGLFSKHLCQTMGDLYDSEPEKSLKEILVEAVKRNKHMGSSTAVLVKLDSKKHGKMSTCNLGDSGYMIFRQEAGKLSQIFVSEL
jgi:protein phosphatase PTC7